MDSKNTNEKKIIAMVLGLILFAAGLVLLITNCSTYNDDTSGYIHYTYKAPLTSHEKGVLFGIISGFLLSAIGIDTIIMANKSDKKKSSGSKPVRMIHTASLDESSSKTSAGPSWQCVCGRTNASYIGTCACGRTKNQAEKLLAERMSVKNNTDQGQNVNHIFTQEKQNVQSEEMTNQARAQDLDYLKKLKELLDEGVISKEEFDAEKSKILGL